MNRVLDLARKVNPFPNPPVGALIVKDGKIIGEGYHKKAGEPHAEINAFQDAGNRGNGKLVKGATLYCTLEPCFHVGRTPPCVDEVIRQGIAIVVISVRDPNPLTNGKSIEKLKKKGIEVVEGVLEKEGKKLIRRFANQF